MTHNQRLIAVTVGLLASLFGATAFLASVHERVRHARVDDHLARARARAAAGEDAGAVQEYRAVLWLDRGHAGAARGLALALVSLGRYTEAESYLRELLRQDPTDGALNRDLARIHVARERPAEARAAYQRAIYGEWPEGASSERLETRFELVEYLTTLGARDETVAELLRVTTELPAGQTAAARRAADLLARLGADRLALDVLGAAAIAAPRDPDLLAHLADRQAAAGRPAEARRTLGRALAVDARREDLRDRVAVLDRVLALDPTLPGLRLVTRTRRARLVLAAVLQQIRPCLAAGEPPAEIAEARTDAERRLRLPARADAEAAEEELALAARLWNAYPDCHRDGADARAIAQVLQQVGTVTEAAP